MNPPRMTTPSELETWLVKKAKDSPFYFIWYLTGKKPANHHVRWIDLLFDPDSKRNNFVAPRESAKTTIIIYSLLWLMSKNPLLTHALVSVSEDVAKARLALMKQVVKENARYKNVFPHIGIDVNRPDTQRQFSLWDTTMSYGQWTALVTAHGNPKDPTLFVSGVMGKGWIGRRLSGWLIMDDIVDESTANTNAQDKIFQFIMQTLIPCVQRFGKVINIGTRWLINDVYERLLGNPAWKSLVIPAIMFNEKGEPYSYWEEYWSLEELEKKRHEMQDDRLFGIMYLCNVQANSAQLFSEDMLNKPLPKPLPTFKNVMVATDFATSTKERADFSVFAALGVDEDNNVYLLDMERYKAEALEVLDNLFEFSDRVARLYGRLDAVICEKVAFQALFAYLGNLHRPDIPFAEVTPKGDKTQRARVIADFANRNKFFINQDIPETVLKPMKSEYRNYLAHPHDDTVDAVSIFFQYAKLSLVEARLLVVKPKPADAISGRVLRIKTLTKQ